MKRVILGAITIVIALIGIVNFIDSIYAATSVGASTSGLNMSAIINPSSTINLSTSNVSLNITPSTSGTFGKSSALVLSAYTNTSYDCNITMTASSSSLVSGANSIPSLTSGNNYTDATFTNDSWGFQIENGTNYRPVLAGEGANPIKTISSMTGGTANTTNIYFAAKLTQATKPGAYTNTITFASTCVPPSYFMQDQTQASLAVLMPNNGDSFTLYDRRDSNSYTVKKINGEYWMTQNLRTTGTVSATDSNFTGSDFNVSQYSIDSSDSSYTGHCDSVNGYNYACAKNSGSTTTGVWYNYYAATAGTISTDDNETDATSDICPSGWHLPSGPVTTAGTDFSTLIGNTTSGYQNLTEGFTAFNPSTGGLYYNDGVISYPENAYWWSSTANSNVRRYFLNYRSTDEQVFGDSNSYRYRGVFIRCVKI